jgi:hypothetical protein
LARRDRFLAKIDEVTLWSQLHQLIEPFYPKAEDAGRPTAGLEYKRGLVQRLWELLQQATSASDNQIVIGVNEVPPSQAMMGRTMPAVGEQ